MSFSSGLPDLVAVCRTYEHMPYLDARTLSYVKQGAKRTVRAHINTYNHIYTSFNITLHYISEHVKPHFRIFARLDARRYVRLDINTQSVGTQNRRQLICQAVCQVICQFAHHFT